METHNFNNLWVEKYRPTTLDALVLEPSVRADILKYKENGELPHLLFYGEAGGGKTTLARILVNEVLDCQYMYINASDENGIDTVRGKITSFAQTKSIDGKLKIIILDEVDGFTAVGQGALRNVIEEFSNNVRFILTGNFLNKIITPILSRCIPYKIEPPIGEFAKRCATILKQEGIKIPDVGAFFEYVKKAYPDMRLAINCMQRDSLTGELQIKKVQTTLPIVADVLEHVIAEKDSIALRKMIIERASEFGTDYRALLHGLFNAVYDAKLSAEKKKNFMIELSSGLYKHELVMDKEINAYATLLRMIK